MKKIIFVINNLETGGVQSSLLNLLRQIHSDYSITVFCFAGRMNKEYAAPLPHDVRLITSDSPFRYLGMSQKESQKSARQHFARSFWAVITRVFGRTFAIRLMLPLQKRLGEFDCAISYLHEAPQKIFYGGCNEFVLKRIKAKKKITWLHCDFGLCGANSKASGRIYRRFDKIMACSEGARASFVRCMPQLAEKCVTIRNCNDFTGILRLAGNGVAYNKAEFNIVTVARLSREKGIERALAAIKDCIDRGYRVHYHLVGSGDRSDELKDLSERYGLKDIVTFYGERENPYPYMKSADLFLLPSYHEAAPMVFDEAACLGIPVLATKTTSTDEMLVQRGAGIVCENSQEGISAALLSVLRQPEQLVAIRKTLEGMSFTNAESIEKFSGVINA